MNRKSRSTPKGHLLPKGRKNHKKGRPPPGGSGNGAARGHTNNGWEEW